MTESDERGGDDHPKKYKRLRRPIRVLFLHGREGNPHGSKATWLRESYQATIPPLDTSSIAAARADALGALRDAEKGFDLLVGSSFGGALAMALVSEGHWDGPVVLLAPAVRLVPDLSFEPTAPCVVVQGRSDSEVKCEQVMERLAFEGSGIFVIQGPWEHRLKGALKDGTIRRAIQWVLGQEPLSSPEKSYARARRRDAWPEVSPPEVIAAFQAQVVGVHGDCPDHPLGSLMDAVSDGEGLCPDRPLTGATVAQAHELVRLVGWVFHGNRARNIDGGFADRLFLSPQGEETPTLVLHATFPAYYGRNKGGSDVG